MSVVFFISSYGSECLNDVNRHMWLMLIPCFYFSLDLKNKILIWVLSVVLKIMFTTNRESLYPAELRALGGGT